MFGQTPAQDSDAYQALLEELNLTDLAKRVGEKPLGDFGDHISGGERQRICIARLCRSTPVLWFLTSQPLD